MATVPHHLARTNRDMALHLYHGPQLEHLGDALVDVLAKPLDDPFQSELVSVPTAGVRDWVQRHIASSLGIACNVHTVFPGQFIAAALGRDASATSPWDLDRLSWAILSVLQTSTAGVPAQPTFQTARRIADLFDRYATNRPSVIQQWALGHDGDGTTDQHGAVVPLSPDQRWQPALWREVRAFVATPNQAEDIHSRLLDVASGAVPLYLPQRVAMFGISGLSPGQFACVQALSQVRDVHVFIAHPSPAAWSRTPHRLGGRLVLRTDCDAVSAVNHPLVQSWARPGMEAAALLGGVQSISHQCLPVIDASTDLTRLQSQLLADTAVIPADTSAGTADGSIQLHGCHGAARQLEVLRDALGHLFANDHTLQPHQVLVVCPDLPRFAPLVASVFNRGSFPIPVRVSDLSLGAENPVAAALLHIVRVLDGRCHFSELLDLCSLPPLAQKLGISVDDIALFERWFDQLGTRWGIDGDQTDEWLAVDVDASTWQAGLNRILVGAAMPAPTPRSAVHGVVPFDDVGADHFRAAGRLAGLVSKLRIARAASTDHHQVHEWCDMFADLAIGLLQPSGDAPWQLAQVLASLDDLRNNAMLNGQRCSVPLSLAQVIGVLSATIDQSHGRLNLRSGSVSMTGLVPVRNVPARVVCVLGLDEGSLRGASVEGDDLLSSRPCIGERDPRSDARAMLLDLVVSCRETLIVTYDGSDITTNRPMPLPVRLTELVDALPAWAVNGHSQFVHAHPRHGHNQSELIGAHPFSFDGVMLSAATHLRDIHHSQPVADVLLSVPVPKTLTLAQLAEACTRPARTFLFDRVDARLPRAIEDVDPNVALSASRLELSQYGRELVGLYRASGSLVDVSNDWKRSMQLDGRLPPQQLGQAVIDTVATHVELLLMADPLGAIALAAGSSITIDLSVAFPSWFVSPGQSNEKMVRISSEIESLVDSTLVVVDFTRPKNRHLVRAALDIAALVCTAPDQPWQAIVITRSKSGSEPKALRTSLKLQSTGDALAAAQRLLGVAVDLRLRAMREPIPLFEICSRVIAEHGALGIEEEFEDPTRGDMADQATRFLWGHLRTEDMLELQYREQADHPIPPVLVPGFTGTSRAASFAHYLWRAVNDLVVIEATT